MRSLPVLLVALVCTLATVPLPGGPVHTAKEAKIIAEQETRGLALSARKVYLNGATCGWEVVIHMPGEARGWRCVVDCDTHSVFTKARIPNPETPHKQHGSRRTRSSLHSLQISGIPIVHG